ncbi:GNAT family N-acetyltransferase [Pedomonas mirosovicensis]|uniref:GNAT family N-acetyltransferase n=1 Tax=Pedomonas mirosovicensis TaxID=2908641 RepID=UPI002167A4A6|nr:hypothetical protein [Pedomonas mirosovicensis]MCH8683810.1 hypothetical protein [Pedomonas mirosovicensis]
MSLKMVQVPREDYDALASVLADNSMLPGDLAGDNRKFFAFVDDDGWRVAVGSLEIFGEAAILRSFLTTGCHHGQGLCGTMLEEVAACARREGIKMLYIFTDDESGIFSKLGFTPCEERTAPDTLRASAQFAALCKSGDFMMRPL